MKITNQKLFQINEGLNYLSGQQTKVWYAISKNKRKLTPIVEGISKDRVAIIDKFALKTDGEYDFIKNLQGIKEHAFATDKLKQECEDAILEWGKEEVEFEFHTAKIELVEGESHPSVYLEPLIGVILMED